MKSFYGIAGVIEEICADDESALSKGLPCRMGMSRCLLPEPRYAVVYV